MRMKYELNGATRPVGRLRKLVVLIVTMLLFALALMFSAVLLMGILVVGTIAGIYLWWKTRELRKMMRDFSSQAVRRETQASNDAVFEGEVIRVVDPKEVK